MKNESNKSSKFCFILKKYMIFNAIFAMQTHFFYFMLYIFVFFFFIFFENCLNTKILIIYV